jgi:SAM-dependent methyltransferase
MTRRPGAEYRQPSLFSTKYAVRAPLARWLRDEGRRAAERERRPRLLDVGCGSKPYLPFFEAAVAEYVGLDAGSNPVAELEGPAEEIPAPDASFDLVLCTQTLEHVNDPARVVRELRRVTAPGGRVLASTHGVHYYHPNPDDFWRWTHAGLDRLFRENADWQAVNVTPASGTAACTGMVVATFIDLLAKRARVRPLAAPVVASINLAARGLDGLSAHLREPHPGTLFANYHVVAEP